MTYWGTDRDVRPVGWGISKTLQDDGRELWHLVIVDENRKIRQACNGKTPHRYGIGNGPGLCSCERCSELASLYE